MKRIVITGADGVIGSVLVANLRNDFDLIPLYHRECDLTKFEEVVSTISNNTDVIIHLAWDKKPIYEAGKLNADNILMALNVFEAAVKRKVKRVILASSIHADLSLFQVGGRARGAPSSAQLRRSIPVFSAKFTPRVNPIYASKRVSSHDTDKRALDGAVRGQDPPEIPTSIYGATKIYFEALGRYYATYHHLEVVAIRFGGVNRENSPAAKKEPNYDKIFLSHQDLIKIVRKYIDYEKISNNYLCHNTLI